MNTRGSVGVWGFLLLLTIGSALMVWGRLGGLPDLGVLFGPDLTVRHVAMERSPGAEGQPFQRGDRLISIEGMVVEDLGDLRSVLPSLLNEAAPVVGEAVDDVEVLSPVGEQEGLTLLNYQIWRPIHRFSLAMQGEGTDPTQLPAGIEPDDRLVEIDGRILPGRVGAEGIRSVIASRPEALLGFERRDAVFAGQLVADKAPRYPAVLLAFLAVVGAVILLWRGHSEALSSGAAYCIALETLFLGLLALLITDFQWVLADHILAASVVVALIMMRPLALFAQGLGDRDEGQGGKIALGIGVLATLGVLVMLGGGSLSTPEQALHVAAIVAGLFIVFEVVTGGMEREGSALLAERGGYLPGVVLIGLFICLVVALMEPVAFEEDRWRWFAVLVPSLVWFGDILYALKFGTRSAFGEVSEEASRQKVLQGYLQEIALEMPHTDLRIVGHMKGRALAIRRDSLGVQIEAVSPVLADAMEILIQEQGRVPPAEGMVGVDDPVEGLAEAMDITLALMLEPPAGMVRLGAAPMTMIILGMRRSGDMELPGYASSQTLDRAQELWTETVASAALLELVSGLIGEAEAAEVVDGAQAQQELDEAQAELVRSQEEQSALVARVELIEQDLERERLRRELCEVTGRRSYPAPLEQWPLIEPELVEGLLYLLEGPEPIVFGGAVGAGKGFTAFRAALLEERAAEAFLELDTLDPDGEAALDAVLGEVGGGVGPGLLEEFEGALLVRGAQRCSDARLLALCHQAEEKGIRLFLSFDAFDAEEQSVLAGRPVPLQDLLGHREVIIPSLHRRPAILGAVLEYWLFEWAYRYGKEVDGYSRAAFEALELYDYPGEVAEAVEIVRMAVLRTAHDVVDLDDLPLKVREVMY